MASKTQPAIPPPPVHLETIYEESSGSVTSSIVDVHYQSRNRQKSLINSKNQTIHGLISARSIPTIDVHRRTRAHEYQRKPPVEVRYRDGTKYYIQPSLKTTVPMIMNRRKYIHTSRHDSSSLIKTNTKYRQIFNTTPKKKKILPKKPEIILTIITNEDLSQAGITPPSTSSPDETDTLALTKSLSSSSLDTMKTMKDVSIKSREAASIEQLPVTTVPPSIEQVPITTVLISSESVQPVIDTSISNIRFPLAPPPHHSQHYQQLRHPQQIVTTRSRSLPPTQSHALVSTQQKSISNQLPPVAIVPPSPKISHPSLQITLRNDENKNNISSKNNLSNAMTSSSKSTKETINSDNKYLLRPAATILVGGGSHSAFRPFLKPTTSNLQPQIPSNTNIRTQIPTNQIVYNSSQPQQQQQKINTPSHPHLHQYRPTSLSSVIRFTVQPTSKLNPVMYNRRSISSDAPNKATTSMVSNAILSDKPMIPNSQIRTTNYPQQSVLISTEKIINNHFNKSNISKEPSKNVKNNSIIIDPNLQWHSITSKSLYDVPRLSYKYSSIPLRITLPETTPTHNQKLLHKHDIELEKRLLDAGLSPETVALYERILEVADIR